MAKGSSGRPAGEYETYVVRRSWPAATADGKVALVFETHAGVIAIALPGPEAIEAIRSALRAAEAMLAGGAGHA
jgi:hypothetical protein